jgi:hypothetical protein
VPVAGAAVGAIAGGVQSYYESRATRHRATKDREVQKQALAAQTELSNKSLSLEERMVKLNEDAAMQAAAASQAQPSSGIGDYLPWIVGGSVVGWLLLKK